MPQPQEAEPLDEGTSGVGLAAGSGRVIVREPGRWSFTALGAGEPVDASLADVRALLAPRPVTGRGWVALAGRVAEPGPALPAVLLTDELVPTPARAVVALGGAVRAADPQGRLLALDERALALLDALVEPTPLSALAAGLAEGGRPAEPGAVAAAAATLVATGLATTRPGRAGGSAGPPAAAAAESPPERPARATGLRRRVAGWTRSATVARVASGPDQRTPSVAADATAAAPPPTPESLVQHVAGGGCGERVPVFGFFGDDYPPPLSLGVLTAALRAHDGGGLRAAYCFHAPAPAREVLAAVEAHAGPVVLLCSNYVWSLDSVLAVVAEAKAANPAVLAVHGGPSTPTYEVDARPFCRHPSVDLTIRGESEVTLPRVLEALRPGLPAWDLTRLESVPGLQYWLGDRFVRTEPAERPDDPGLVPSPWLTGEFDAIDASRLNPATIETNRGCPYGCTFCDWGSATNSRLRFFEMERIRGELEHFATRGIKTWMIADANFGITSRDVEITEEIVRLRQEHGVPQLLAFCVAKNTTKHLTRIVELLVDAGIFINTSLSLQTRDAATLAVVDRANISVDKYDELTASFRRHGLPLVCDLLLGLPGATVTSYRDDIQFCLDHNLTPRTFPVQIIPNAPMNDPDYRRRHQLVVNDGNIVVASSTFTEADHAEMMRLRTANQVFDHFGVARLLLRYLQWDRGRPMAEVLHRIVSVTADRPADYPVLAWLMEYFELFLVPPVSWPALQDELGRFVADELGLADDPMVATVLAAQLALLPDHGRTFPHAVDLDHDVVAYWLDACRSLEADGSSASAARPLATYGPGRLEVTGDPCHICDRGLVRVSERRDQPLSPADFWQFRHFELDSPLARNVPGFASPESYLQLIP